MLGDEEIDRRMNFLGEQLDEHMKELTQDRDAALAENVRLRQALTDVCSPMQMFLRGIPPEQRQYVDASIMVRLCDSVGFIQEIARKALETK